MTNFAALLDRVIARDVHSTLGEYLETYYLAESGLSRRLRPAEAALILAVVNDFLTNGGCADLGMAEFADLGERLAEVAEREELSATRDGVRIRNCCFDALACIKALEARLSWCIEQVAIRRAPTTPSLHHPNDR